MEELSVACHIERKDVVQVDSASREGKVGPTQSSQSHRKARTSRARLVTRTRLVGFVVWSGQGKEDLDRHKAWEGSGQLVGQLELARRIGWSITVEPVARSGRTQGGLKVEQIVTRIDATQSRPSLGVARPSETQIVAKAGLFRSRPVGRVGRRGVVRS